MTQYVVFQSMTFIQLAMAVVVTFSELPMVASRGWKDAGSKMRLQSCNSLKLPVFTENWKEHETTRVVLSKVLEQSRPPRGDSDWHGAQSRLWLPGRLQDLGSLTFILAAACFMDVFFWSLRCLGHNPCPRHMELTNLRSNGQRSCAIAGASINISSMGGQST